MRTRQPSGTRSRVAAMPKIEDISPDARSPPPITEGPVAKACGCTGGATGE